MRVNVIHPKYLSDQHLVAEYREVKMGPKALSRSLSSLKGVDKNKISPKYTLNTGHTYFFYDKNLFLKRRLKYIVEEMQFRGFATNHTELIDDSYAYHKNTFNKEWWGEWNPDQEAIDINLERINERFHQKSLNPETKGWYKLFGYSVPDMDTLIKARVTGKVYVHPQCASIIDFDTINNIISGTENYCWVCCKKIESLVEVKLTKREQKQKEVTETKIGDKKMSEYKLDNWKEVEDYFELLKKDNISDPGFITARLYEVQKFISETISKKSVDFEEEYILLENLEYSEYAARKTELKNLEKKLNYDEFDLEVLCKIIETLLVHVNNRDELLKMLFSRGIPNKFDEDIIHKYLY